MTFEASSGKSFVFSMIYIEFTFLKEFLDKSPVTIEGSWFLQVGLGIILWCVCRCGHHWFCCSKVLPISVLAHQLGFSIEGQGICFHPQISVLLLDQMLVQEESFLFCHPSRFGFSFSVKSSSFCQIGSSVCQFSVEESRVFLAHSIVC